MLDDNVSVGSGNYGGLIDSSKVWLKTWVLTNSSSNTILLGMNTSYSITSKFQVTIPKKIRDELRLTDKDRVSFERRGNELVVKKVQTLEELAAETGKKFRESGLKPATEADIKNARIKFYQQGGKW